MNNKNFNLDKIFNDIKKEIELHDDIIHKKVYSVDASIYEIEPIAVALPKNREEVVKLVKISKQFQIPITPRGAATGITGGCIGRSLIMDLSKYMNRILEINYDSEYAVCEPGVVQDQLNQVLGEKGYRLGPDTSTGNRATLGGMLGNNAAGARSLKYGVMADHVLGVELILASGEVVYLQTDEGTKSAEKEIYRKLEKCKEKYKTLIEEKFPHIPRKVSGYNLDRLIAEPFNPAQIIAGSEGTLGIATEIKVRISKKPELTGLLIIHVQDLIQGLGKIEELLAHQPISVEMIDHHIITAGRSSPALKNKLGWLSGNPKALFVVELEAKTVEELNAKLDRLENEVGKENCVKMTDPRLAGYVWELRKSGLGLLLSKRSYSRAIAFIEDISVPPWNLAAFMEEFLMYMRNEKKDAGIYGHIGSGCMHIRPYINLRSQEELDIMQKIMLDVSAMVLRYGGAMSGEHGDGIVRSWLNERMFGKELYEAFIEIKKIFDPDNLMNPGKIVHPAAFLEDLRISPETSQATIDTFFDFTKEGGFELAVDLCNGNGMCRKKEGVMCPSFQATEDEYDTTRARAQALRAIVNGRLPKKEFGEKAVLDVLDLCLQCKGCKTECPSNVDMAKMKSEYLYHYGQKHGYSLRSKLFGHVDYINRKLFSFRWIFNLLSGIFLGKWAQSCLGIAPERTLPPLADERFSEWDCSAEQSPSNKKVVLFNDTYTEYNHPEIGKSACKLLNRLGYEVIVPNYYCCGKPLISKGLLKEAKAKASLLIDQLYPYAREHVPIIGLEPSCILTLKDEYLDFQIARAEAVAKVCMTLDQFLSQNVSGEEWKSIYKDESKQVVKIHGHCHQKSLEGMANTIEVLKSIPGFEVSEIPSGCCGMAGSFGYEKEHYKISMKIGSLILFPAVRKCDQKELICANGMSCRTQIKDGTDREAHHLAEILANRLASRF